MRVGNRALMWDLGVHATKEMTSRSDQTVVALFLWLRMCPDVGCLFRSGRRRTTSSSPCPRPCTSPWQSRPTTPRSLGVTRHTSPRAICAGSRQCACGGVSAAVCFLLLCVLPCCLSVLLHCCLLSGVSLSRSCPVLVSHVQQESHAGDQTFFAKCSCKCSCSCSC